MEVSKNVNVTLCGMKNISLTKESIKILGVHICFNKKIQDDSNFTKTIKNLCNIIKLWSLRKLNLEGKITIFQSLTISKIMHLVITTKFPDTMIEKLKQVQKNFFWDNKKVQIKQNTLRNDCKNNPLNSVDIEYEIASLNLS